MRLMQLQALIHSDSARTGHLVDQKAVKLSTYVINFVGTTHQGGNGVGVGKVLINVVSAVKYTTQKAVQHLAKHSEWLQHLQSQYLAISGDFETVCYYETYDTPLPGYGNILVSEEKAAAPSMFSDRMHITGRSKIFSCHSRTIKSAGDSSQCRPPQHDKV